MKSDRICLFPPRDLQVRLEGSGHDLKAHLTWSPPRVNAASVGGYLVERTVWWHGMPRRTTMLTRTPLKDRSFVDRRVVPCVINEYRVFAVHRSVPASPSVPGFPAAVYGFAYIRYGEMVAELRAIARRNPDICRLVDAGPASGRGRRVWCMVLGRDTADHPDKPGVLLVANPHAGEVESADAVLGVLREAVRGYRAKDPVFVDIFENIQTRIIPMCNPHGRALLEEGSPLPARKTSPAVLLPPPADPLEVVTCWRGDYSPGIDPNRTFDAEWTNAGVFGDRRGSVYSGRRPFDAPEVRAVVRMARALRPQISVQYHGPCGAPLYPGKWKDGSEPPDRALFLEVGVEFAARSASEFAGEIVAESPLASSIVGTAIRWFYREFYGAHLCPEGFHEQLIANQNLLPFTDTRSMRELIPHNLDAFIWLARRIRGAGIHVRAADARGRPLEAAVEVVGCMDPHCFPQRTDRKHGSYRRVLSPGIYTVRVSRPGFHGRTFRGVRVGGGKTTALEAVLLPRRRRAARTGGRS